VYNTNVNTGGSVECICVCFTHESGIRFMPRDYLRCRCIKTLCLWQVCIFTCVRIRVILPFKNYAAAPAISVHDLIHSPVHALALSHTPTHTLKHMLSKILSLSVSHSLFFSLFLVFSLSLSLYIYIFTLFFLFLYLADDLGLLLSLARIARVHSNSCYISFVTSLSLYPCKIGRLNQQIVMLLTGLGVPKDVFIDVMYVQIRMFVRRH